MVNLAIVGNIALDRTIPRRGVKVAVPIGGGFLHVACPNSQMLRLCSRFRRDIVGRIIAVGGGHTGPDQDRADVQPLHGTTGHGAAIAVGIHGNALGAIPLIQRRNLLCCPIATGPVGPSRIGASLADFRCINPEQPHPDAAHFDCIAVDHLQYPRRIVGGIGDGGHSDAGQENRGEQVFDHAPG